MGVYKEAEPWDAHSQESISLRRQQLPWTPEDRLQQWTAKMSMEKEKKARSQPAKRLSAGLQQRQGRLAICCTPSAVQKIKQLLKDKPEHVGVKVGVRTRGCNGLSYTLEYTKSKGDSDEEVVQDGVRVFIEKKAQLTLLGTEMDYVEDKLSSEFVFNNPNIKGTCGCGESFNI
ncbi:PREDICTED: iron-sulfur cluster assembly 1 homolog, mitochondrial [Chaetura pelagica]|uniref:iron-sulfur cluster assembly 1 homolog, mitochondrial n=1 Tax=Chaetura pelagica TaxID=8897 RepID=UPI00052345B5|nr:PREDICTED: iron-sulfur cluster assembly 1 homolog, mitochondrial [Chaetura pelagica]